MNYVPQIFVLSSLRNDGERRLTDISEALSGTSFIPPVVINIDSEERFRGVIAWIRTTRFGTAGTIGPFLHITAHGSPQGIEINPSKEFIGWADLENVLSGMCEDTVSWPVIYLEACYGLAYDENLARTATYTNNDGQSYYAIISAKERIHLLPTNESKGATAIFYGGIDQGLAINSEDGAGDIIIKRMRTAFPRAGFEAHMHPSWLAHNNMVKQQLREAGVDDVDI